MRSCRCGARDSEERVDRRLKPVDLRERGSQLGRLVVAQLHRLQLDAQRRQRRAQLMRGVRGEGALAADELVEPFGRRIECSGDGIDLRDPLARRPDGEVAVAQPGGRECHALQRERQPSAEHARRDDRQQHHCGAHGGEQQPGLPDVADRPALVSGGTDRSGHPLTAQQRHRDQQVAGRAVVRGPGRSQRGSHGRVGAGRAPPRYPAPGAVVDGEVVRRARQLDPVGRLAPEVDLARGRHRVALEAQQLLVTVGAPEEERERHGEQDDGDRGDAGYGGHEPASHYSSKR